MLRMQNIAGRRGLYDVLSTQYQHSSDFKGLSFGGDASKRRKGNNGVTAEAIQDEGTTSNDAKDQEIERLRKELQVKKNSEAKLVETLDSVSSKVSSLKNSNNSLKAKLSSYERENLSLKDKVTAVEGEKEALSQQLTALKEDDEELEGYQEVVTRQSASVVNKWKHACHSLSEEKRQLEEQAKEQDDYIEQIENQIQNVQSKYEAAKQKIKKLREEKSELETKNEELQASMKESSGAITHEKETLDSFKEILLDIQRQINSKASVESITRSINSADRIQQEAEVSRELLYVFSSNIDSYWKCRKRHCRGVSRRRVVLVKGTSRSIYKCLRSKKIDLCSSLILRNRSASLGVVKTYPVRYSSNLSHPLQIDGVAKAK
eukprot:gb/GECG01012578.1/.p1 GENE.gb/GECG01012578.1/~~gb/GECG01012578.1/.p1  ORF type:complete len:377 (+),score=72.76 gb/GECG01012578.1/:1-1131(+)